MQNEIKQLASQLQVLIPYTKPQFILYNFAFGALYAFARAIELKFDTQYRQEATNNKVSSQRAKEVQQLATDLSQTGKLPPGGRWLAGHYYNSALLRVDVCYEQAVRYYLAGEPISIFNFGVFMVRNKAARRGRNPRTGEDVTIAPRRVVTFRASPQLKSEVDAVPREGKKLFRRLI